MSPSRPSILKGVSFIICGGTNQALRSACRQSIERFAPEGLSFEILEVGGTDLTAGQSRNEGLRLARYPMLVFMDEDCQVPDASFFQRLSLLSRRSGPALFGGSYESHPDSTEPGRAYNWVCRWWQASGPQAPMPNSLPRLLGGIMIFIQDQNAPLQKLFKPCFGGEEYSAIELVHALKGPVEILPELKVFHLATHDLPRLLNRAKTHANARSQTPLWKSNWKSSLRSFHAWPLLSASLGLVYIFTVYLFYFCYRFKLQLRPS